MMYVNCTPHAIVLNDGRVFEASGTVARCSEVYSAIVDDVCVVSSGEVVGLPAPAADTRYIVSAMVLAASTRGDLVAPATGHRECKRNDKGQILSVPCFVVRG